MDGDEDFVFRPVLRGLIHYESLFDGTLSLAQIAVLNEAIAIEQENQVRARKAAQHNG